jgi:oxygen-independent coproporphyrinogen-3 oxidase
VAAQANPEALGVYVSVPFCRAKCSFCNFASGVSSPAAIESYLEKLAAEIDRADATASGLGAKLPRVVDTVYLGGGTPSLLSPEQLDAVFAALRRNFDVTSDAEITLEAAPGQIGDSLLQAALRLGVNRVSLGVQSFVDRESAAVGRSHTGDECIREIARLRAAGVGDVGADLIAGLPYQTEASWRESLARVADAGLTHVSVYMLEVDEDSRLGREVLRGGLRLHAPRVPGEELVAELYEQACEELPRLGFAQYEISNFAAEGFQSRHNRKYWERAPYLGFGLDAHSMLLRRGGAVRFATADELNAYDGSQPAEITPVGAVEGLEESVFLGLRLCEGVSESLLSGEAADAARELVQGGLMSLEGARWRLTLRGRLVSNEVFSRLLEQVAA